MKVYFSIWYGFENIVGIHLLPGYIAGGGKKNKDVYTLYFVKAKNVVKQIGDLKIIIKEESNLDSLFKDEGKKIKETETYDITHLIQTRMALSIPSNIDYYKAIASIFDKDEAISFLKDVRDISYNRSRLNVFKRWTGFSKFIRDNSSNKSIIENGVSIATGDYKIGSLVNISLDSLGDSFEPFQFSFRKGGYFTEDINLLIGKNGLGKTHILKYVCEVITGLRQDKNKPLLNKLIVVSFSPFENFSTKRELIKLISLKNNKKNKLESLDVMEVEDYSYIGFRDLDGGFDKNWPGFFAAKSVVDAIKYDNEIAWWLDGEFSKFETLFTTLKIAMDFDSIALNNISGDLVKVTLDNYKKINFDECGELNFQLGLTFFKDNEVVNMSSGQKIFSYMIPSIISEVQDESLLIIDEPELYLHPALEIALIEMLKTVLSKTHSFAIIATHSAVIAREVKSHCVRVLRETDGGTMINNPSIETYGESLDEIVGEVFGDYFIKKPYQDEIDSILQSSDDMTKTLNMLSKEVGDDALIYLLSQVENDDDLKG
jgi:predicted ATPase